MSNTRFNFENKDLDFPFYNENPLIPKWGWIVLFLAMFIGFFLMISSHIPILILGCVVLIVPVLYFLKWDYKAIFQKPSKEDVYLAIALFVGYMIYGICLDLLLKNFGIFGGNTVGDAVTWMSIPPLVFSLLCEEFIKFIPFMFFLRVAFKFSNNRKLSIIVSMILVMLFFASLHAISLNMLVFAIFVQGFGSIFEFIGYIKTKNILIPYMTHLCTDVFIFVIAMFGF